MQIFLTTSHDEEPFWQLNLFVFLSKIHLPYIDFDTRKREQPLYLEHGIYLIIFGIPRKQIT